MNFLNRLAQIAGLDEPPKPKAAPAGPPMYMADPAPQGLVSPGNIDLTQRPQVKNPDGSISTVRSISIDQDGHEVLLPTVIGDRVVSNDDAIQNYMHTGQNLGTFSSPETADAYAQLLHEQQAKMYPEHPLNVLQRLAKSMPKIIA